MSTNVRQLVTIVLDTGDGAQAKIVMPMADDTWEALANLWKANPDREIIHPEFLLPGPMKVERLSARLIDQRDWPPRFTAAGEVTDG